MRTYRVALVAAIMTAIAMTVSSTASAEMRVFGKVQQAMVENSYWDHNHGHGLIPTDWQANHCTHAWEATVIWGWGAWEYWGGRNPRCVALLHAPHAPTGPQFMKIERGYWTNVMAVAHRGNPCYESSATGQPRVPWDVMDDLIGTSCPDANGWG
jgi:hypothetical protein